MLKRLALSVLVAGFLTSCVRGSREETNAVPSKTIEEVLAAHSDSLMALPGVVGTAIGLCDGSPCIHVFLADSSPAVRKKIPDRLEGYRVKAEVTGPFHAR